ncbi:hypothetical protein AGMMS50239_30190 [Bacteroidia bacterium]|nr:hypothetical protein AGMMS50239_30190 [Bacteroidia bacterium]
MKPKIFFTLVSVALLCVTCKNEDLGNYDYHEITDMKIAGIDSIYQVMVDVGFLDITPAIILSDGGNPDDPRYEYLWISNKLMGRRDTIGHERTLHWQASLPIDSYDLYFRVTDKETGMLWKFNAKYNIVSYHSRGFLMIGENAQGKVQVQMLSMLTGQDTVLYTNLLANSELPELTGPKEVFHTGSSGGTNTRRIWVITESGSYWIDRFSLKSSPINTLNSFMLTPHIPALNLVNLAPRIKQQDGGTGVNGQRFFITGDGNMYASYISIYGGIYEFPVNCLANDLNTYFPASPCMFYALNSVNAIVWYDTNNERFMIYTSALNKNSTLLTDGANDSFPWNQEKTGRTLIYGENTRDTEGGSGDGNSFAIMHSDTENSTFIYKFYAKNPPQKRACYTVSADARTVGFDQAEFYAFSSNRPLVFFVATDHKLYCYDYNPGNERVYPVNIGTNDRISMIKFDRECEPTSDYLYIATCNAANEGTLTKYSINTMGEAVLTPVPHATWTGLVKIVNMSWRGSE